MKWHVKCHLKCDVVKSRVRGDLEIEMKWIRWHKLENTRLKSNRKKFARGESL